MRTFPELLRYWREHHGLSLSKAAAKAGITKAHLWELEVGRARNPTIGTLAGLAAAYGGNLPHLAERAAEGLGNAEPAPVAGTENGMNKND